MASSRRGPLKPKDSECIREHYEYLKVQLDAVRLMDFLYQEKILEKDDLELIQSGKTKSDRNRIFLDILLDAGPGAAFDVFMKSLTRYGYRHVLDKLTQSRPVNITSNQTSDIATDTSDEHIFISYCHANKDIVHKIYNSLKDKNYKIWIDEHQMEEEGNLLDGMSSAVQKAWLVLMCVSEPYHNSRNCKKEAEYTSNLGKEYIIVKVQPKYKPTDWLGILVGEKLYYEFGSSTPYDEMIEKLTRAIECVKAKKFQHSRTV